jgi:hypothetical protein
LTVGIELFAGAQEFGPAPVSKLERSACTEGQAGKAFAGSEGGNIRKRRK